MKSLAVDVLIVGGGIAGLWALAAWRAQGLNALLVSDELGAGQTIASQGIIHGGTKYSLSGQLSKATLAIGDMPRLWRNALAGEGAVDLSAVDLLTSSQLLWTSNSIGARMTGFFASKAMKSRMDAVPQAEYPDLFQHDEFHGGLYRLDEPVLDIPLLLQVLQTQLQDSLLQVDTQRSSLQAGGEQYQYQAVLADGQALRIQAEHIVLTAGAGNAALLGNTPAANSMQRRPLQMVLVRGDLPPLYAHALGMSDKPRCTITSHRDQHGRSVWYIGGQPAEQGVGQEAGQVIAATQQELSSLLPWMDFSQMEWATWCVDRAEGRQGGGLRPDQPIIEQFANVTVAWPTKLAFAPMLAHQLNERLQPQARTMPLDSREFGVAPALACPIWDQVNFNADVF